METNSIDSLAVRLKGVSRQIDDEAMVKLYLTWTWTSTERLIGIGLWV